MCGRIVVSLPILAAAGMIVGIVAGIVCPLAQQLNADTPSAQEVQATLFVATNGNDAWSGKLPAPNPEETDGPLATLRRARDVLRQLKASQTAPLVVMVRGGKYPLRETLVLGEQDSGTGEYPVTYRAYPGEKPLLSGGRRLTGWKPYKEKILQCDLQGTEGGNWKFRQLFLGGHRQTRARHPDTGQLTVVGGPEEPSHSTFFYEAGSFPRRWARPTQGEVFMVMHWGYTNLAPIQKIDAERRTITSLHAVKDFTREPWGPVAETHFGNPKRGPYRFHVENLLEELDRPGEWCLDTEEGRAYFWPPDGSIDEQEVGCALGQSAHDPGPARRAPTQ